VRLHLSRCSIALGALGAAVLTAFAGSPTTGAREVAPVAVTGDLPAANAQIQAIVLQRGDLPASPGVATDDLYLGSSAVTISSGEYQISVDPRTLPTNVLTDSGTAAFEIDASTPSHVWTTTVSARAVYVGESTPAWTDPEAEYEESAPSRARASRHRGEDLPDADPDDVAEVVADDMTRLAPDEVVPATSREAIPADDKGVCPGRSLVTTRLQWATLGTTYPVGNSTSRMAVSTSQGASYGVAVSASDESGSWSANGSSFTEGGWSNDWPDTGYQRAYMKQVQYGKYKSYLLQYPHCVAKYGWDPMAETGGTDHNDGLDRPGWDQWCVPVDVGTWKRDSSSGSSYTNDTSVKFDGVIGINLSISRQYSTAQKLVYNVKGPAAHDMCGSNTWPSSANKLMERNRN
jgi:hypothetical protein